MVQTVYAAFDITVNALICAQRSLESLSVTLMFWGSCDSDSRLVNLSLAFTNTVSAGGQDCT